MEIHYTDEFNRQGTVYFVNDSVNEQVQYVDSDSDTMSTCSTRSASTITSSDVSDFYLERHGRVFPRDHNIPAILPIDEPEHDRLEKTHQFLKLLIGSNYWGPVQEVMRSKPHPRVLDLRTQGGSWVQEMATEFPHAHFTSLDLVPMVPHAPRPNVTFEIYDLYAGLAEPDESFDIIHARDCVCWVKNYDLLLREFHRVLRPGGLLLIGELGYDIYEAYDTDAIARGSAPRIHAGLEIIKEAARSQGVMVDSLPLVPKWLAPDSELWTTQSPPGSPVGQPLVQRRKRGFTNIETRPVVFPNGRWHPDPLMQRIGGMAQEVWHSAWYSVTPMLLERGMDAELVRDTIEGAMQELMDPTIQTVWKYMMIHCIKV